VGIENTFKMLVALPPATIEWE